MSRLGRCKAAQVSCRRYSSQLRQGFHGSHPTAVAGPRFGSPTTACSNGIREQEADQLLSPGWVVRHRRCTRPDSRPRLGNKSALTCSNEIQTCPAKPWPRTERLADSVHVGPADTGLRQGEVRIMYEGECFHPNGGTAAADPREAAAGETRDRIPTSRRNQELQGGVWAADRVFPISTLAQLPSWAQPRWLHLGSPRLP
jgi:hypothetical protein